MNRTRLFCLLLVFTACAVTGNAGILLYTFGGIIGSPPAPVPPVSLNSMSPGSSGSPATIQNTVGDGTIGFNGGLVGVNGLLYAIGNDTLTNEATLYSMNNMGVGLKAISSDFNTGGGANGVVFNNGLAAAGGNFYAIGQGTSTEDLYEIGAGTATDIQTLDVNNTNALNGTYAGLAWDSGLNEFYAIIANAADGDFTGDFLVRFQLGGVAHIVADLTRLDHAEAGTHLGGLVDAGDGILYDIYTNPNTLTGMLEEIDLNGTPSVTTLYDTGIPLAQNAGIAILPEPATTWEIGAGMILLCCVFRRTGIGSRRPQAAAARCKR